MPNTSVAENWIREQYSPAIDAIAPWPQLIHFALGCSGCEALCKDGLLLVDTEFAYRFVAQLLAALVRFCQVVSERLCPQGDFHRAAYAHVGPRGSHGVGGTYSQIAVAIMSDKAQGTIAISFFRRWIYRSVSRAPLSMVAHPQVPENTRCRTVRRPHPCAYAG